MARRLVRIRCTLRLARAVGIGLEHLVDAIRTVPSEVRLWWHRRHEVRGHHDLRKVVEGMLQREGVG